MNWSLEEAIARTGMIKQGHFLLSSGRHSSQYLQCAQLLQYPKDAEQTGIRLAKLFADLKIDVVVGPALGGVIIAHEVARALGVRCLFTERKNGQMVMRRGFELNPKERVLIVEDVVTTGGSVREVIDVLEAMSVEIVGIGSIFNRSGQDNPFGNEIPYRALKEIEIDNVAPEECPLCKQGVPAVKPGSRNKQID